MSSISSHVLDTSCGRPAKDLAIRLEKASQEGWDAVGHAVTNSDGRIASFVAEGTDLPVGNYRLLFDTDSYFRRANIEAFYPSVQIDFAVTAPAEHYHVPLLLNPFGYSTYRGS